MQRKWVFSEDAAFDPDAIKAMALAYDHVCTALNPADGDPLIEAIAKSVIEHARRGEREAIALSALVLRDLRSTHVQG